ncbi:MAG TPA: prenyltransferase/squalene oxidase repeat-containing protein, partial [Planctomycetota bacterium]
LRRHAGARDDPRRASGARARRARARRRGTSAPHALAPEPLAAPSPPAEVPAAPARGAPELARAPAASPAATALRAPDPPAGEPAQPAPSARFDATADLAPRSSTASPRTPSAPTRPDLAEAAPVPVAPAPLALSAPPPPAASERPGAAPRLAETPYRNRFGAQKLRALEEHGGSAETERAVAAGLAYLARIQERNGAWGQRSDAHSKYLDVRIGKTGLALLAFLGAGHVPEGDTEHAGVAARAVAHLLAAQDAASGHFGSSCSYGHGIATYALAECFALTGDERLRAPLERALEEILRHQSRVEDPRFLGGWGYYYADGRVWNRDEWPRVSVTAWQVMALESARLGGLGVPDQAFEAARAFLRNAWDPRARAFRYDHDPERLSSGYPILPASTPAALFALSLLGVDPAGEELAAARRFVLTRAPDGYRYTGDDDFVHRARGNPYFWYYATLALFRVGGSEWERWNRALQETLLPAQEPDGSWRPLDVYAEYAGDEDDERTYATAMSVLSLEIYYRYFTPLLRVR